MKEELFNTKEIADDFKTQEKSFSYKLDCHKPIVIRLDMRAGGSFVKKLEKPFDDAFTEAMQATAKALCEQLQSVKLGYVGSDEITLLFINTGSKKNNYTPFFEGKLQKMVSLAASIASLEFSKAWLEIINQTPNGERKEILQSKLFRAQFDARAFNVDGSEIEALKSVWWRLKDVKRNSIQMFARSQFSHKQLMNKGVKEMSAMLNEIGKRWDDNVIFENRLGSLFLNIAYEGTGYNPKTKEEVSCIRHKWDLVSNEMLENFDACNSDSDLENCELHNALFGEII